MVKLSFWYFCLSWVLSRHISQNYLMGLRVNNGAYVNFRGSAGGIKLINCIITVYIYQHLFINYSCSKQSTAFWNSCSWHYIAQFLLLNGSCYFTTLIIWYLQKKCTALAKKNITGWKRLWNLWWLAVVP